MQQNDNFSSSPRINESLVKLSKIVQKAPADALNLIQKITQLPDFQSDLTAKAYVDKFRGIIFFSIKQYDKAYRNFQKALINFEKVGNLQEQCIVLNNISLYYCSKGDYDRAVKELEKTLDIYISLGNRQAQLVVYNNIGEIYRTIDRHDKAIRIYEKVLSSDINHSDRVMICLMKVNLADSFLMSGMISEAKIWIDKTDENIIKCADLNLRKLHFRNCYNYFRLKEDYKMALEFYIKFSDYREQQAKKLEDFQSEFFLKKQELEILKTKKEALEKKNIHLLDLHETLKEKNIFLNTIINTIPVPFFFVNNDDIYLECNDEFAKVFGLERQDFIGKKMGISSSMSQIKLYNEMDEKLRREKKMQVYETSLVNHEGSIRNVIFFKNVFHDKFGEVAGILGSFIDLTEAKQYEESISKINTLLSSVMNSPYKIYIASIDRNYKYTSFNDNYVKAIQRHRNIDLEIGAYYLDNYPDPEDKEKHRVILDKVIRGELHTGFKEYNFDNKVEIIEFFYCPIYDDRQSIVGMTIYSVDVTDKMLAQRDLQNSKAELISANKTKDQFFSIIAHDLRSLLGNIRSVLEFISANEDSLSEEGKNDFIKELHLEANETFNLLENLLLWYRSQRNGIIINPTNVKITRIVGRILKLYYKMAQRKNIQISSDIEPDLVGHFDYNAIETVIRNLLNNSLKFTPTGGKISISASKKDNQVYLIVSDTGIGIAKDRLSTIFRMDETYTLNHSHESTGSGLDLILSHDFIEKNGGEISVKSTIGSGTTFTVILPIGE